MTQSLHNHTVRRLVLGSVSAFALAMTAAPAFAQQAAAQGSDEQIETVVVSGSRLVTNGNEAPTPVTVVTAQQLQMAAPRSVADGLLQLPAFNGSSSVQNQSTGTTGSNGATNLNLRGLGAQRTLVLLDGRRVPSNNFSGSVDVQQLPDTLVQRVDVVTGGASAAYGSDAVAGVVNFILNTKYEGFKADLQGGISQYGDNDNYKVGLTYGDSYLGGRLHLVTSFQDYLSDGVTDARDRPWTSRATAQISNPGITAANATAANPVSLVRVGGVSSVAAAGGLITGSFTNAGCTGAGAGTVANPSLAGCAASTALRGTTFNSDGTARAYQYGTLVTSATMQGGEGVADNPNFDLTLQPKQRRDQFFGHVTYDLDDDNSVFFETSLSHNHIRYQSLPTFELSSTNFTVFSDNAYLPTSIKNYMTANNLRAVNIGRDSADFDIPTMQSFTDTGVITVGADGKLPVGSTWTYHAYGQMGQNFASYRTINDPISDNLYAASDAVFNSSGQVVCRSSLNGSASGADPGCVPIDIFGRNNASAAAKSYITGTAVQRVHIAENVVEGSASGELFDLPAGAVSAAVGANYRTESGSQTTDTRSNEIRTGAGLPGFPSGLVNSLGGYERTNPQPTRGSYDVTEAFAEVEVPLLKDMPYAKSLSFNAAGRYVDYSLSGDVEPWKLGLVWEIDDQLRLRASKSADIRAANLGELYQGSSQGTSTVMDSPNHSVTPVTVLTGAVGNPALVPESSDTWTVGGVLTPDVLPGFSFTLDYYSITISKAISTLTAQQVLDTCAAGATQQCSFVQRNSTGGLARILLPYFNAASRLTKGEDMEVDYHSDMSEWSWGPGGDATLRLIGSHIDEFTTDVAGAPPILLADDIGVNSTPAWKVNAQLLYQNGPWSGFLQERFIGSGKIDRTKGPTLIDYNEVEQVFYTDLTVNYDITEQLQGFLTINNLFDRDPPPVPSTLISGPNFGNRTLYDLIGRQFTVGVHYKM